MKQLVVALLALSACDSPPGDAPLTAIFDCDGGSHRYRVLDSGGGNLALEIEQARSGPVGVSTYLLDWTEMRTGYVGGQQGGHQSHLRLSAGNRHYIFFEGEDGLLADRPGRTYAGVALVQGDDLSEPISLAACDASPINRSLLGSTVKSREAANLAPLPQEVEEGAFDAWF